MLLDSIHLNTSASSVHFFFHIHFASLFPWSFLSLPFVVPFFLFSPFQYYYYYLCDGKCAHTEDRRPSTGGVEHREQQSKMEKYFRTTSLTDCVGVALIIMTLSSLCRVVCRSSFFSVLCFAHDTRRKKRQTFSVTENILLCHKTFPPTYTPSSHMPK